jgi:DNA-binding response OmpR family regulator
MTRILLVDDEPTLLFALHDFLDQCGYEVHAASELEEAFALLNNIEYDVVITDIRLSALQGAEGLHILEMARDRSLPSRLVVLTGTATEAMETAAMRLGVDRFIRKPVPLGAIDAVVKELLMESVC